MGGCKIAKFVKIFSLESFPLYGNTVHVAIKDTNMHYHHRNVSRLSPSFLNVMMSLWLSLSVTWLGSLALERYTCSFVCKIND